MHKTRVKYADNGLEFNKYSEINKILPTSAIQEIEDVFEEKTIRQHETIIAQGEDFEHLYYLKKGLVKEINGYIDDENAPFVKSRAGDIIGLQFLGSDKGKSFTNWLALTQVTCGKFKISDLLKHVNTKQQEEKIWEYIGPAIIHLNPNTFPMFKELDVLEIKLLLKESLYETFEKGWTIELETGAILFEGSLERIYKNPRINTTESTESGEYASKKKDGSKFENFAFIYPTSKSFEVLANCKLFRLPEDLKHSWNKFDHNVFSDKFQSLPAVKKQHFAKQSKKNRDTRLKRQKTKQLHMPRDLARKERGKTFEV